MKKKKNTKTKKIILIAILGVIILGVATILIINSTYRYDPTGRLSALADGEKGVLTLEYGGADGKPEKERVYYEKGKKLSLPTLTKKGLLFFRLDDWGYLYRAGNCSHGKKCHGKSTV